MVGLRESGAFIFSKIRYVMIRWGSVGSGWQDGGDRAGVAGMISGAVKISGFREKRVEGI